MLEDISGEWVEVELGSVVTCKVLKGKGFLKNIVGRLLVLRNFSLEPHLSSAAPYALVCYNGRESKTITTVQLLSFEETHGKQLWEKAQLHHDHCCHHPTFPTTQPGPSNLSTVASISGSKTSSSSFSDITPMLIEMKGAVAQQNANLFELQGKISALCQSIEALEEKFSVAEKRKREENTKS